MKQKEEEQIAIPFLKDTPTTIDYLSLVDATGGAAAAQVPRPQLGGAP